MGDKVYLLTGKKFDIKLKKGGIYSLKNSCSEIDVEFIEEQLSFGHLHLTYREGTNDWHVLKTEECTARLIDTKLNVYEVAYQHSSLEVIITFQLVDEDLTYSITCSNKGTELIEIGNLSLPFPMNSEFKWGDDANKKVLKHSFISGHNSYIFWERCNGEAPYLLMTPLEQAKFEYFNLYDSQIKENRKIYEAFIYSKKEGEIAASKGCHWRQEHTSLILQPDEKMRHSFKFQWKINYNEIRKAIVKEGLLDIQVVPGMTVPNDLSAKFYIDSVVNINQIRAEYPEQTEIKFIMKKDQKLIYQVKFETLGENYLEILFNENKRMILEFFCTEPIETLIRKRAAFIANHQVKDSSKWYDGLLAEWNMETKTMLGPDNYDRIKGWRRYEVTCDDPGLSKPAFLSTKLVQFPVQEEMDVLDYYIEKFVWGGLQRTNQEQFSYGIYGIPDWKENRESSSNDTDGQLHIWRIYDYPHIILMYWNMYQIRKFYSEVTSTLNVGEYLNRAYQTAIALFTIPWELEEWSAFKTGLYNELIIPDIIDELYLIGMNQQGKRLERLWVKKVKHFVLEKSDLFGSEYPFDTTGFESTYAFANYANKQIKHVVEDNEHKQTEFTSDKVNKFMELQRRCNIACRGYLEPAYYLLGSDYRIESCYYALSYMAQMGANGILTYALEYLKRDNAEEFVRLGYASLLSSWALVNSGNELSDYGYWYKGIENDGGAGGGFEPAPYGETWLNQEHHRGSWYYSCEIDLGFCGAVRSGATVVIKDSIFNYFCYGGDLVRHDEKMLIYVKDGIRKKIYFIDEASTLKFEVKASKISQQTPFILQYDWNHISCEIECSGGNKVIYLDVSGLMNGVYDVKYASDQQLITVTDGMMRCELKNKENGNHRLTISKLRG